MATSVFEKGELKLEDNILTIFGASGLFSGDEYFVKDGIFDTYEPYEPYPTQHEIIANVVNADIADGNFDKIDHVKVDPNKALRLYLEGPITYQMVREADVDDKQVSFAQVKFKTSEGEKSLKVIVDPEPQYPCATIDSDGNIIGHRVSQHSWR